MRAIISPALLLAFVLVGSGLAEEYHLDPSQKSDTVYFRSTAKLEFIEGKTSDISGYFTFDPAQPGNGLGRLIVDLRTLKTGIGLRDEHMRERHLHTEEFPYAYFELTRITGLPDGIEPEKTYNVTGEGHFYIHGVKRPLTPPIEFTMHRNQDGSTNIMVRAAFPINLDEYRIDRPKALFMKLVETIEVEVVFWAYEGASAKEISLPEWQEVP